MGDFQAEKLPSRRELRLARQAAEREAKAQEIALSVQPKAMQRTAQVQTEQTETKDNWDITCCELNPVLTQEASVKELPESDLHDGATEAIPAVAGNQFDTAVGRRAFNAKFSGVAAKSSSFFRKFVRKSPELSAVALASIVVATSVGVLGLQYAEGAQSVNSRTSVLGTVTIPDSHPATDESNILQPTEGAAELAKIIETQIAANSGELRCVDESGANALGSAYADELESQVFFPMKAGTYNVSSPFGPRQNPTGDGTEFHTGVDFAAPAGTPIYAVADGVVEMDGSETEGNHDIRIRHEINGEVFYTWYLHSYTDGIFVKAGQSVKAGEKIAEVGSSGRSTGTHLHFEIRPTGDYSAEPVEPVAFISELGAIDISQKCK